MSGLLHGITGFHPALVHFPVALTLTAAVAEGLYMGRKAAWFGDAARFMLATAACLSIPAAATGFVTGEIETIPAALAGAFSIHRVAGLTAPVLIILAYALGEGTRRSGQVWEQGLYRLVLLVAALCVLVAGYFGGELVHGH